MPEPNSFSTLLQPLQDAEAALSIDPSCRSRFLLHDRPTSKVILFFHGFTAVPQQFVAIGQAFFEAGYNVLIPLMPGHGLPGDWNRDRPPPLPHDPRLYQEFGRHWLGQARLFGDQVVIGGLSGGSTLCGWLALAYPTQIDRALLFAPYLGNTNLIVDLVVRTLDIYFEWKTKPGVKSYGYKGFAMPALRAFLELGQTVLDQAEEKPAAPMLIVSSDRDAAVNLKDHQTLFHSVLKHQPQAWYYRFDRSLDVPHNMMTEEEGNHSFALLVSIAKSYVESSLTWAEVESIRDRIRQGETFDRAISELMLQRRTSPELRTMLTLVAEAT